MMTIEELEAQLAELEAQLAELEGAGETAAHDGQRLHHRWRAAVIKADIDGDAAAAREAGELQRQIQNAAMEDQRRNIVRAEVKNRIRSVQGQIVAAKDAIPREYQRRRPGVYVPGLTRWARGLPERLGGGGWEDITRDRLNYELTRSFGSDATAIMRSINAGNVAKSWDYEFRVKPE